MNELFYYQIDGVVYGAPHEMTKTEADERNAQLAAMKCHARWLRQHEFCWIADVEVA